MGRELLPPTEAPILEREADEAIEAEIERRVAARCKAEAFLWRFRLIAAESAMMGALVAAAGIALDKPATLVLRAALLVASSCFASGMLLLGLTGLGTRIAARLRRRWRR
jgi:hypothetical protein